MIVEIPGKLVREVLSDLRSKSKECGVKFQLVHNEKWLDNDTDSDSSAYFIGGDEPEIKVSTVDRAPSEWLVNAIHEDGHLDQWHGNTKIWQQQNINDVDVGDIADLWIRHEIELSGAQRSRVFDSIFGLEQDAEIRTIRKLRKYGLDKYVDPIRYAKESWSYINGYTVARNCRVWLPAKRPAYKIESIVRMQPSDLNYPQSAGRLAEYFYHYKNLEVV